MRLKKINIQAMHYAIAAMGVISAPESFADTLNTAIPKQQEESFSVPINVDIPKQPLANSLHALGKAAGMSISFPNDLVSGKTAPEVRGRMSRKEALQRLLDTSGLVPKIEGENVYIQKAPPKVEDKSVNVEKVEVRAKRFYEVGPLPGLGLTKEEIPGNVQSISAKEIKEAHSLSLTDLMNRKLQSVTVNDYQGNPFQMDVQYRGFTAGPQIGTPQGLSVFFDGIRVNEPFGDVVNWDMLPMNALAGVDVFPGSNPIFGLNTLGGAFTVKTKDGFNHAGFDAEVLTGSFGRKQLQTEAGWNNGTFGLFAAGNFFLEDGWRENSPSKVNQFFGKASYRGDKLDLNLSTLIVGTDLVGNGLIPSQMYKQDRNSIYSSPDTTENRLQQFQLSSSYFVNESFTVTGQIYRRNSDRKQTGADVMTGYDPDLLARRRPNPGDPANGIPAEQYSCLLASTNTFGYSIPDYYLIPINQAAGEDYFIPGSPIGNFYEDFSDNGRIDNSTGNNANFNDYFNTPLTNADGLTGTPLTPNYVSLLEQNLNYYRNFSESRDFNRGVVIPQIPTFTDPFGNTTKIYNVGGTELNSFFTQTFPGQTVSDPLSAAEFYFYTRDNNNNLIKNQLIPLTPINADNCRATQGTNQALGGPRGGSAYTYRDANGNIALVDGAGGVDPNGRGLPGVVEGTPTAVITNNQINQLIDGASIQFNWNLEKHKFMIGASIDAANADYTNTSQLGFLTADRKAYLDPEQANPQFGGALIPLANNNFEGTQTTKSIYISETWSPIQNWSFTASGRYNMTKTKNKIAARYGLVAYGIGDLINTPDTYSICQGDCTVNPPATNYRLPRLLNVLDPAETEKFSFHSFNPSFGGTWQAKENLNVYANWAKGTRVPSVIELGCALDKSSSGAVLDGLGNPLIGPDGKPITIPKSVSENRQCTLPTTLSGDPYLPQIKATTYDLGMRGTLNNFLGATNLQWNLGAYQTDLKDDIYFVAVASGGGFFDTVGKTRRRGIEAGISGRKDKWGFGVNYALTDATFEDTFLMQSDNNSSSFFANGYGNLIVVKKGSRIPGVSLHNLNANISYEITPQWQVGLSTILHSESFVRGNENNEHRVGVVQPRGLGAAQDALRRPTSNPGTIPSYATFNFQTSYKFNEEWMATLLINNVFDKEYFTAGRLGRNPFSPSIDGAIGPDGYNHNSNDWLSTNFIAPGAPRGIWFSLNWRFVPDKK